MKSLGKLLVEPTEDILKSFFLLKVKLRFIMDEFVMAKLMLLQRIYWICCDLVKLFMRIGKLIFLVLMSVILSRWLWFVCFSVSVISIGTWVITFITSILIMFLLKRFLG